MTLPTPQHRRPPWALALLLALLLLTGWGQVHRVLHLGWQGLVSADVVVQSNTPGLADEEGSSLCQLLDQLSHGAGPTATPRLALGHATPLAPAVLPPVLAPLAHVQAFAARGPPMPT